MRDLCTELWGKESPSDIIEEFTIEVPKPQFCREPGFRAGAHDFPLTGALEQKTYQVLQKLQTTNKLPCGLKKLLVTKEYVHVENLLRDAERKKWSDGTDEPSVFAKLDFQISGQPGSGTLPTTYSHLRIIDQYSLYNPVANQTDTAHLYTTFTCFGPNVRTCLKTIPANSTDGQYDNYVESYLSIVDEEIRQLIGQGNYRYLGSVFNQGTSHTIGLMEPNEHGNGCQIGIITRWIAYRINKVQEGKAKQNSLMLFKSLSSQPSLRNSAGWFFEAYAHDWFGRGGSFQADELPIKDGDPPLLLEFKIQKSKESNYFSSLRELASQIRVGGGGDGIDTRNLGKYFQPYGKPQESFDGLVFNTVDTLILLQCIMAERHDGVQSLLHALPATIKKVYIVFVVPNDCADNYANPQKVPGAGLRAGQRIKQFRLVLLNEDIESLVNP
ncbi:squalene synthetase-like protein [Maublancomyces gigas]|uniref:Squalene synthetase-like protein n=1 Tax=Discina gigas TaxID=1032678 RepID=A0ABR3GWT5_9PEZI